MWKCRVVSNTPENTHHSHRVPKFGVWHHVESTKKGWIYQTQNVENTPPSHHLLNRQNIPSLDWKDNMLSMPQVARFLWVICAEPLRFGRFHHPSPMLWQHCRVVEWDMTHVPHSVSGFYTFKKIFWYLLIVSRCFTHDPHNTRRIRVPKPQPRDSNIGRPNSWNPTAHERDQRLCQKPWCWWLGPGCGSWCITICSPLLKSGLWFHSSSFDECCKGLKTCICSTRFYCADINC